MRTLPAWRCRLKGLTPIPRHGALVTLEMAPFQPNPRNVRRRQLYVRIGPDVVFAARRSSADRSRGALEERRFSRIAASRQTDFTKSPSGPRSRQPGTPDNAQQPISTADGRERRGTLFMDVSQRSRTRTRRLHLTILARQALLPKRLSQLGPGVSWFVSRRRLGRLACRGWRGGRWRFSHDQRGKFAGAQFSLPRRSPGINDGAWRHQNDGKTALIAGSSNDEDVWLQSSARVFDLARGRVKTIYPANL